MSGFDPTGQPQQPSPDDTPQGADGWGSAKPKPTGSRQLALVKRGHRYVFDYTPGQESEVLERLVGLAHDPDCTLGMFDAAVLCHQLGTGLSQQVDEMLRN